MLLSDVDFLKRFLKAHPELRLGVRLDPPRVHHLQAWHPIQSCRLERRGLVLALRGGPDLLYSPKSVQRGERRRFAGGLLETLRYRYGSWEPVAPEWDGMRLLLKKGARRLAVAAYLPASRPSLGEWLADTVLWWNRHSPSEKLTLLLPQEEMGNLDPLLRHLELPAEVHSYSPAALHRREFRSVFPDRRRLEDREAPIDQRSIVHPFDSSPPPGLLSLQGDWEELALHFRMNRWELSYLGYPLVWHDPGSPGGIILEGDRASGQGIGARGLRGRLEALRKYRRSPPPDPSRPEYRFGQERWLESLFLNEIGGLNRRFAGTVYCQVPSIVDRHRKVLDAVTAQEDGRVAVLEFKAHRDLLLPMQGLEYLERVRLHLENRDFELGGYFPGIELRKDSPLLYLICPSLSYHPDWTVLLRYLRNAGSIRWLGVNADWRRGLRVFIGDLPGH